MFLNIDRAETRHALRVVRGVAGAFNAKPDPEFFAAANDDSEAAAYQYELALANWQLDQEQKD